jgi:hypothetical protein
MARDLDSYYSLGYRQESDATGERSVVVKVKDHPEYQVRARRSYVARSIDDEQKDRVIANIFSESRSELPIALRTGTPKKTGRNRWTIPIEVAIPPSITLLPDGSDLAGGFSVFIAVGDPDGALSDVSRIVKQVRIPLSQESMFRGRPMLFTAEVATNRGQHTLSIGVVDQLARTSGYAKAAINVR